MGLLNKIKERRRSEMSNAKRNLKRVGGVLLLIWGYLIASAGLWGIFSFFYGLSSGLQMSPVLMIVAILFIAVGMIIIWSGAKLKENWQVTLGVTAFVFSILHGGLALVMHMTEKSYHMSNLEVSVMNVSFFFSAILSLIVGFGLILYHVLFRVIAPVKTQSKIPA
jgi:hypothetical protein